MNSFDRNKNQSTISSSKENKKIQSTTLSSFCNYINEISKKLYTSTANEINKITQHDLTSKIKQVCDSNHINETVMNDIVTIVDGYFTEANIVKINCLSNITQHLNQITQYSQFNMNDSLDESIGILNSLSESIQKLLKGSKTNLKTVSLGFKSLSFNYSAMSDYLRKQKPVNAIDKLETIIRQHNDFDMKIKEINDAHDVFYRETKGFFKQLKDLHDERLKKRSISPKIIKGGSNSNTIPVAVPHSKSKGKLPVTNSTSSNNNTRTSSYMNYTNNGKTLTNKTINKSLNKSNNKSMNKSPSASRRIDTSSDQYSSSGEQNKTMKTLTSNKSFINSTSSKFYNTTIDPESSMHLIKKKNSLLIKEINELKLSKSKDRQEKTFLLKEITKLNTEIEKYKESGFMVNSTVSEMIKGGHLQRLFTYKDFNNLLGKITKISEMTIGFANSLNVLQDAIIRRTSSSVELKLLYDSLKKNLIQIINDISLISKSIVTQYDNAANINGQCDEEDKIEETEELQNEIFELKTQMAMVHSQHTEEISQMQKKINDAPSRIQQQTFCPIKTKPIDNDEIPKLKNELMNKSLNESALERELADLKIKTTNEINELKGLLGNKQNKQSDHHNSNQSNSHMTQISLDNLKIKHNQNIEQLKKAYQEIIDSKDKMIVGLNQANSKFKAQIEDIENEKNTTEATMSNNLIQYEIDISNIQNEKMQIEILLEEQKSNDHFNQTKIKELTEALISKEQNKDQDKEKDKEIEAIKNNLIDQQKKEEEMGIKYQKLQEENKELSLKIIELSSIIESKELIEESSKANYNALKEKLKIVNDKENDMLQKYNELNDQYIKIKELNESLLVDKMILSQKNDDLISQLTKYTSNIIDDISNTIERVYHISEIINITLLGIPKPIKTKPKTTPTKKAKRSFLLKSLITSQEYYFEIIGIQSKEIVPMKEDKPSSWQKLSIITEISIIEIKKIESNSSRSEKQLINKQKEELAVLRGKLSATMDHSTKLTQQLEEIESNHNSEKEEYKGMLRVAFQKFFMEIQLSPKSKEFSTVILKMLDYTDDDIFEVYNSGKKKTLFGFLK